MPFPFFMLNSILFRAPIFSLFHPVFSIVFSPSLPFFIYISKRREGEKRREQTSSFYHVFTFDSFLSCPCNCGNVYLFLAFLVTKGSSFLTPLPLSLVIRKGQPAFLSFKSTLQDPFPDNPAGLSFFLTPWHPSYALLIPRSPLPNIPQPSPGCPTHTVP